MRSGHVDANGLSLYYEAHGDGEPLLLIMGLGQDTTAWALQIPAFAEHFRVVAFDNRDAGRSSQADGPYTIADMARDTAGLMDALGLERAHVLGASMGGAVAQELALRWPDRVGRLVLACTMGQFARFRAFPLEPAKFIKAHDPGGEVFLTEILVWCMTHRFLTNAQAVDQMLSRLRAAPFPQTPGAFARQVEAARTFDALDRLGAVEASTLVLVGDQDILTPPWAARELAEAIPGARLQVLEGAAHGLFWECPGQANRAVLEFLRS